MRFPRTTVVAALLALLTTGACSAGGEAGAPAAGGSAEPRQGGTLLYLEHQAHTNLYPPTAGFYPNGGLVNNLADRLVYQNPETLKLEPWIATKWQVNQNATEYTFTIRDGVTFSDGTPLT